MRVKTTHWNYVTVSVHKVATRGSCILTPMDAHGWIHVDVHHAQQPKHHVMRGVQTRENKLTNHIALETAAQYASVPVNHMTMTAVNHNAHHMGRKWINLSALVNVVQHASAP